MFNSVAFYPMLPFNFDLALLYQLSSIWFVLLGIAKVCLVKGTISTRESGTVRHRAVIISQSKSQSASASTARCCGGQGSRSGHHHHHHHYHHHHHHVIISIVVAGDQVQLQVGHRAVRRQPRQPEVVPGVQVRRGSSVVEVC